MTSWLTGRRVKVPSHVATPASKVHRERSRAAARRLRERGALPPRRRREEGQAGRPRREGRDRLAHRPLGPGVGKGHEQGRARRRARRPRPMRSPSCCPPTPAAGAGDTTLGRSRWRKLKPKKSATVSGTFAVPATVPAGTYYVVACADPAGVVKEKKEQNNCSASAAKVTVVATPTAPPITVTLLVVRRPRRHRHGHRDATARARPTNRHRRRRLHRHPGVGTVTHRHDVQRTPGDRRLRPATAPAAPVTARLGRRRRETMTVHRPERPTRAASPTRQP